MGNYAGSIVGWTDSKLAIKGREQANRLFAGLYKHVDKFTGIYSSDLSRSIDTSKIALGFCNRRIIADQRLR
jgi:broad specificity phosphatase PhoE